VSTAPHPAAKRKDLRCQPFPHPGRALRIVRLAWSVALLAAPGAVVGAMGGRVDTKSVIVARILGARHAAQSALELATWPRRRRAGWMVDGAHSLTAAGLAAADASWRRVALADSVVAAAFASAGLAGLASGPERTGS
jgi:hypothetical protein